MEHERAGGHVEATVGERQIPGVRHGELDVGWSVIRREGQNLRVEVGGEDARLQLLAPRPGCHRAREISAAGRYVDDVELGAWGEPPRQVTERADGQGEAAGPAVEATQIVEALG